MNPVQFYKCLADETRLKCLLLIENEEELCVCELTAALDEIQPKISRHLAQLRQCELLVDRRQGKWVFYRINPDLPKWCKRVLAESATNNALFLREPTLALGSMGDRPERVKSCC
ncbi:MAG: metalloregulator ArsR/SmtB family transcription factor [Oceanospirillaceae bacterium]|nr:metalloregulator ArsR/SmtB family transcription factor [Oceanospirillaceae bacterium]